MAEKTQATMNDWYQLRIKRLMDGLREIRELSVYDPNRKSLRGLMDINKKAKELIDNERFVRED